MKRLPPESPNRLIFFDNLRYLMVLLVLVFHAGASYGSAVAFWPFHEANPVALIDLFVGPNGFDLYRNVAR